MAVAVEVGIGHLGAKFLANTLIILRPLHTAGTIATGMLQSLFDSLNHFLIFVESDRHMITSFPLL